MLRYCSKKSAIRKPTITLNTWQ